ncbi:MAG: tRNA (adenosine(37)-N6)-dimethylallyltransferase MiaA [Planctomycetes bacterium]|nr:tRNA (adenosine(37)-N6)-dimethylallyltransferase MiaA [Planctomycetota bacterium]
MHFPAELLSQCWFLCGPTACGKTALSLSLANRLNAEIVALDSMTLYRGMNIGTAKPSIQERSQVPHHLIDVLDPHEECSLADYLALAERACLEIVQRGSQPLFVGGTGLYLRSVLRGVFAGPAANWGLRRELEARVEREGPLALHAELQRVDPHTANRLHPNDVRRVIRALEIFRTTGQPMSSQLEQGPRPASERTPHVYWLSPERDWLYQRINQRVIQMFDQGLVSEVRRLIQLPRPPGQTARQGLGYKEVIEWLESSPSDATAIPSPELIDLIQTRTRQFAKRQHTWFRNLEESIPIPITGAESVSELTERIASRGA